MKSLILFMFLILMPLVAWGMPAFQVEQPDTTQTIPIEGEEAVSDTTETEPLTGGVRRSGSAEKERKPQPEVIPMKQQIPAGFNEVFSDSLLRWEQWYNIAERDNSRSGVISYRLGALGRHDGIMHRAIEPRHRRIYFDGIPFHDPVTGGVNTNFMPLDRMQSYAEQSDGSLYRSWFELDRFYVSEPLTWINVENTKHDVRRAEGIITTNIDRQTNIELSYRGNNDGAEYRRNVLSGRQASIRLSRYLSDKWAVQAMLFYNSFQMDESLGFEVDDPLLFPFIPDFVTPNSTNSNSSVRNTLTSATVYYRPVTEEPVVAKFHLYENRFRRLFHTVGDSTFVRTKTRGLYASYNITAGAFSLEPHLNISSAVLDKEDSNALDLTSWSEIDAGFRAKIEPAPFITLTGWSGVGYRTDNANAFESGYRVDISIREHFSLYQSLSFGSIMPTIQQKYWQSKTFSGNPAIRQEQIARLETGISWGKGWLESIGIKAYGSDISAPIINDRETGEFINIDNYRSVGAEIFMNIDSRLFEVSASTTFQTYLSNSARAENVELEGSGLRIWNRLSAFYKNYFFDFATYAKIGASAVFSPNPYFTSRYIPVLDLWDPLSEELEIPAFFRLDLEASARVRNVMFLLKYENILDGVGQNGYFETAGYPMPSRRYRVGIRWILRN